MSYKPNAEDKSFYLHYLAAVTGMGNLARSLQVNCHEFNSVPTSDISYIVNSIKDKLDLFVAGYRASGGKPQDSVDLTH